MRKEHAELLHSKSEGSIPCAIKECHAYCAFCLLQLVVYGPLYLHASHYNVRRSSNKRRAMCMQRMGRSLHGAIQHMGAWVTSLTQAATRWDLLQLFNHSR